ncbi:unnamed protein product, partial [Prorocentrum cordatum]
AMPKARRPCTVCAKCGGWVYDWKLQRSDGWCDRCNDVIDSPKWQTCGDQEARGVQPPWWSNRPRLTPEQELDTIIKKFEEKKGSYKVDVDLQALRDFRGNVVETIPKKRKRELPQSLALKQAVNRKEQAQKVQDEAAAKMAEAEAEHQRVLDEYSAQSKAVPPQEAPTMQGWKAPEVDESLFEELGGYDAQDRAKLLKFKGDMQALAALVSSAHAQCKDFDELAEQAKAVQQAHKEMRRKVGDEGAIAFAVSGGPVPQEVEETQSDDQSAVVPKREKAVDEKKQKAAVERIKEQSKARLREARGTAPSSAAASSGAAAPSKGDEKAHKYLDETGNTMDIFMMCETHAIKQEIPQAKSTMALDGRRLLATPATPTRKSGTGASGGELIAIRSHIAATGYDEVRAKVQGQGMALVGGVSLKKICALAAFAQSIADPWVIMADWSAPCQADFLDKIGAVSLCPDVTLTCDKGKGSLIDCGIARKTELQAQRAAKLEAHLQEALEELEAATDTEGQVMPYMIPLDVWQRAQDSIQQKDMDHQMSGEMQCVRDDLTYGSEDAQHQRTGRAAGMGSRTVKTKATPGRARMKYAPAEHWGVCTTLLSRYLALRLHHSDFRQQRSRVKELQAQVHSMGTMDQEAVFGKKVQQEERSPVDEQVGRLGSLTTDELKRVLARFERFQAAAQARGFTAERQGFTKWAKGMSASKPGALHRRVKEKLAPVYELALNAEQQVADPDTVMEHEARFWEHIWKDPVGTRAQITEFLVELAEQAKEDELEPVTIDQVDAVINRSSDAK